MKRQSEDVLYRVDEAAQRLGIAPKTLRNWIYSGRLEHVRLGRSVRVKLQTLNDLVAQGTVPAKTV